jgi:cytosine/adenosine deaminase-related metal-dependent hydrolase
MSLSPLLSWLIRTAAPTLLAVSLVATSPARAENKLLVTNATIITFEDDQPAPFTGYLLVGENGRITAVAPGAVPEGVSAMTTYDAGGKIVMPGFLSGHSHLWQSAFRGIAADQWVTTWMQKTHRTYSPHFMAGDPYTFTLHGALDYLRHGITTTYNYSQIVGGSYALYLEQYDAEIAAGARFIFGYAMSPQPTVMDSRARFMAFLAKTRANPNPLLLKVNLAAANGRGSSPEFAQMQRELMDKEGLDLQMHFQEPPSSQKTADEAFAAVVNAGYLGPKLVFSDCIHITDAIIEKAGAAHAGMIWNPLSNGRLASGLADIPKYLKAGMSVGMGIDGQASAGISDPFENMRLGLYATRMKYEDPLVMMPIDVLKLHTIGTARTLGVGDQVGSLKVGKFADFLVVDPNEMDTGPVFDLYATLVFACSIENIERTYVGGEFLVERGKLLHQDFSSISQEVKRRVSAIRARQAVAAKKTEGS